MPSRSIEAWAREAARQHGVLVSELRSDANTRRLHAARVAFYRAAIADGYSHRAIGRDANRDHSCVTQAVQPPPSKKAKVA